MTEGVRIVTGAASGIGCAVAERLTEEGGRLLLADHDADGVARVAAEIGTAATAVAADLASPVDCEAVVRAAGELGPLEGLVNVAGVMTRGDTVEGLADDELERILAVNVKAIFRLGRHAIPLLRENGGGAIVNVSSVHAFASTTGTAAYAASKGAVTALTRQLAIELAPDRIRVVAVAPGSVDTPLSRSELDRQGMSFADAGFPEDDRSIGRVASPRELAEVVAWLLSERAGVVNGTTLVADAGLLARLI